MGVMDVWVPPAVSRKLEEERRQYESAILLMSSSDPVSEELTRRVEEIDVNLAVVKAKPTVQAGLPLRPGYYHLIRRNEGAPMSVATIEGPNGEMIEPGSQMLDMIRGQDLQNPRVRADIAARDERRRVEQQRELDRDREAVNTEVEERVLAATRAQVSMSTDTPWSQNAAGRRGARK